MRHEPSSPERRAFLRRSAGALILVPAAAALAACGGSEEKAASPAPASPATAPPAAAPAAEASPAAPAEAVALPPDALVTEIAANGPLVVTLQYVNQGADPQKVCTGCQLYTAASDARGRCSLFQQGLVAARGHCTSWIPRQP